MRKRSVGLVRAACGTTLLIAGALAGCAIFEDQGQESAHESTSTRAAPARVRQGQVAQGSRVAGWTQERAAERRPAATASEPRRERRSTAARQEPAEQAAPQPWTVPQPEMQLDQPPPSAQPPAAPRRAAPPPPVERPATSPLPAPPPAKREPETQRSAPAQSPAAQPPSPIPAPPAAAPVQPAPAPAPAQPAPPPPALERAPPAEPPPATVPAPMPAPPSRAQPAMPPPSEQTAVQTFPQPGRETATPPRAGSRETQSAPQTVKGDEGLAQILQRARDMVRRGQVLKAREQLLAAVSQSPSETLLELGRTFDPYYLPSGVSSDGQAEPVRARSLYEEAIKLGSSVAARDLERLRRNHPIN